MFVFLLIFLFDILYTSAKPNSRSEYVPFPCKYMQVSSNGLIAMGTLTDQTSSNIPNANNVVVPYGTDIDPTQGGTVRYTQFGSTSTHINTVSLFIQSQITRYFYGSRMMIVEWYGVPKYGESDVSLFTIQHSLLAFMPTPFMPTPFMPTPFMPIHVHCFHKNSLSQYPWMT